MVLISYVKPYNVIRSDKLISGCITIIGKEQDVLWENEFRNKDFISVKTKEHWHNNVKVVVLAGQHELKKELSI